MAPPRRVAGVSSSSRPSRARALDSGVFSANSVLIAANVPLTWTWRPSPRYHWKTTLLPGKLSRAARAFLGFFFLGKRNGLQWPPTAPFSPGEPPLPGGPLVAHQSALRSSVRNAIGMTSGASAPRAAIPHPRLNDVPISLRTSAGGGFPRTAAGG